MTNGITRDRRAFFTLLLPTVAMVVFLWLFLNPSYWALILLHYHFEGFFFIDWSAVTAAADAHAEGHPVFTTPVYDEFGRYHVYSGLWLYVSNLGINRFNGLFVGFGIVAAFLIAVSLLTKPRNTKELLLVLCLVLSPPFLLGLERANNDLVIFLFICLIPAVHRFFSEKWSLPITCGIITISTVLKYYPAFLFCLPFFIYGFNQRVIIWVCLGVVLSAAQIIGAGEFFGPLAQTIPDPLHYFTFGAANLFRSLGMEDSISKLLAKGTFLAALSLLLVQRRRHQIKAQISETTTLNRSEILFMAGATLIVACFILRSNFAYRLIFCALSLPLVLTWLNRGDKSQKRTALAWFSVYGFIGFGEVLYFNITNVILISANLSWGPQHLNNFYPILYVFQWAFIILYCHIALTLVLRLAWVRKWVKIP